MKKIAIAIVVTASLGMVACEADKPEKGFQSESFLKAKEYLLTSHPSFADMQFCINGAAFVLAGQPEYAEQYEKEFGQCIKALVDSSTTYQTLALRQDVAHF